MRLASGIAGKVIGFKGGKKFKKKSEWLITKNTHPPLITEEVGEAIEALKKKGIRASRYNKKRVYLLSGLLKCADCGYSYVGDRTTYRCNAQTKAGSGCANNGISCNKVEDPVFSFLQQEVLSSNCVFAIIEKSRKKLTGGNSEIGLISERLAKLDAEFHKLLDLYQEGLIDKNVFGVRVAPLNEQKKLVSSHLEALKTRQSTVDVPEKDILNVIAHLSDELKNADSNIVKATVNALIDEILVGPKNGKGERMLSIKGSYLPITRANMVTPRGIEPRFPA